MMTIFHANIMHDPPSCFSKQTQRLLPKLILVRELILSPVLPSYPKKKKKENLVYILILPLRTRICSLREMITGRGNAFLTRADNNTSESPASWCQCVLSITYYFSAAFFRLALPLVCCKRIWMAGVNTSKLGSCSGFSINLPDLQGIR